MGRLFRFLTLFGTLACALTPAVGITGDFDLGDQPEQQHRGDRHALTEASGPSARENLPSDEELERQGVVIGTIDVRVEDVFDPDRPGEGWWLNRAVNTLHINTREKVVREILLFAEGDLYSRRVLEETERLLRGDRLFFDAWVRPVRRRGEHVDVEVIVRDVWTLSAGVHFRRQGGENEVGFNLQDRNLFGTGKKLDLEHRTDVDRTTTAFQYRDPNLIGTRMRLGIRFANNSDGRHKSFVFNRPFFALDTRWAAGCTWLSESLIEHLYSGGKPTASIFHDREFGEIMGGLSNGLSKGFSRRWSAGITFDRHRFAPADEAGREVLPSDREFVYPWIRYELLEDSYVELSDTDQIERTEDFHLGRSLQARVGWSSPSFGAGAKRLIFSAEAGSASSNREGRLLRFSAHAKGRWGEGKAENILVGGEASIRRRNLGRHMIFARLSLDFAHSLDRETQLLAGGDNGLRGYPLRFQDGDRRFLATAEQRFFTDWHLLKLVHVGAAVFVDVGHSWFAEAGFGSGDGVLGDVGLGLRLSSSRSGTGNMLHFDVAFPVNSGAGVSGIQWSVRTKNTF